MLSTEESLRLTVAALMTRTGERQAVVAAALGLSQAQVSRKQSGAAHWSLEDVDGLAAHYKIPVLDLLAGPTHAVGVLHGAAPSLQPGVLAVPPVHLAPAPPLAETPAEAPSDAPAAAEEALAAVLRPPVGSCVLCGQPAVDEVDGFPQHLSAEECAEAAAVGAPRPAAVAPPTAAPAEVPTVPAAPVAPVAAPTAPAPAAAPDARRKGTAGYASGSVMEQITDRVHDVLAEQGGDLAAAEATLIKMAIPDVMALMKSSRVGGRYEHSEFPPTADILHKKSQKGADEIWEGRPKWRNPEIFKAAKSGERFEVTALDMNAAYLSALKCWLPIGQLREDTSGVHDPKKAGVHLITPADWDHTDLPNPLGARQEPGQLWVTESTLRQLLDCARQGLADPPVIHRSLVSGATEALLEKMRRALAEVRRSAIAEGDELTVAYVKAMYSKFVSTIGESSANREIRRPDWMHIIRSKAFANLWMKAHKARTAGLHVVQVSGTDELHLVGEWRAVFTEGRDLAQVKVKDAYVLGGRK
ncbi:helix-turn-helix domain-containing protein [Streptomyces sp. NRRL F-5193]|uniref:helix-turn-helix domain-containing protein n=1 Tax=Streptomyces sp. NRRL F-5193 TaxID=1463860 RepID=UPI0007C80EE2|nr:helix-turn-helix domain-containing protein [Streptomyces sp. NRRL F-5193]